MLLILINISHEQSTIHKTHQHILKLINGVNMSCEILKEMKHKKKMSHRRIKNQLCFEDPKAV